MDLWKELFTLISSNENNEPEILELLKKPEAKALINKPAPHDMGDETMLMWAVWRLKKDVILRLLEIGADPTYSNDLGSSVATYWHTELIQKNERLACEIAQILHKAGADLSWDAPDFSYSLVRRAKEEKLLLLGETLRELGY